MRESEHILIKNIGKTKIVKSDSTTDIDLLVEDHIINRIRKEFPNHNIHSEEIGLIDRGSDYTWIIDPIDGSRHYNRRLPLFSISIALKRLRSTIFAVICIPLQHELFWALSKQGAFNNENRIEVSKVDRLDESFIVLDIPNSKSNKITIEHSLKVMRKLLQKVNRIRVFGVSSLSL